MAHNIIPLIPKHTVYVEPFAGGASVLFLKPFPPVTSSHHYREVINDTNRLVYNFYKQLRENGQELAEKISLTPFSERCHIDSKEICKNPEGHSDIDRARAFFVNINMNFANNLNGGWGRSVFGKNDSYTWYTKIENLNRYLNRMQGVYISDTDAVKCIKQWDSPQTFFYCDPPYVGTDQGHYSDYTQDNLDELVDTLKNVCGSFILSGYDNSGYPDSWERFEFKASCSAAGGKRENIRERTEVVLRKITEHQVRPEIEKLYSSPAFSCFAGGERKQLELFER